MRERGGGVGKVDLEINVLFLTRFGNRAKSNHRYTVQRSLPLYFYKHLVNNGIALHILFQMFHDSILGKENDTWVYIAHITIKVH